MAIPTFDEFMLPMLEVLADGQEHSLQEFYGRLAEHFNLIESDRNERLPSGKQTVLHNRIGWARTYLKKAELLNATKRAHFVISDTGRTLLSENPEKIDKDTLMRFEPYIEWTSQKSPSVASRKDDVTTLSKDDQTPLEAIETAAGELNSELTDELLSMVLDLSPQFFEQLIVDLMIAMGYGGGNEKAGQTTQYSNDGGVDGIINEDPLGLDRIYLQAKRYSEGTVGAPEVQSFSGALDGKQAKKGVFITTSKFSSKAIEFASRIDKSIILIDGQRLAKLMIQNDLGVNTRYTYKIKQIDTDYFTET